jgi:hypothetical protein
MWLLTLLGDRIGQSCASRWVDGGGVRFARFPRGFAIRPHGLVFWIDLCAEYSQSATAQDEP